MPFSIIGITDDVVTVDGRTVKGRQYSWGVAEGKDLECSQTNRIHIITSYSYLYLLSLIFYLSSRERGPLRLQEAPVNPDQNSHA